MTRAGASRALKRESLAEPAAEGQDRRADLLGFFLLAAIIGPR